MYNEIVTNTYFIITATGTLQRRDLYKEFTPQYAAHWKEIGTLLGLPSGMLDIIEQDNVRDSVRCCNAMWSKWLQIDPSASREKLLKVIKSLAVSNDQTSDKGNQLIYIHRFYLVIN